LELELLMRTTEKLRNLTVARWLVLLAIMVSLRFTSPSASFLCEAWVMENMMRPGLKTTETMMTMAVAATHPPRAARM
jgi:hypothetical protein